MALDKMMPRLDDGGDANPVPEFMIARKTSIGVKRFG
jgi:hypothetical protein